MTPPIGSANRNLIYPMGKRGNRHFRKMVRSYFHRIETKHRSHPKLLFFSKFNAPFTCTSSIMTVWPSFHRMFSYTESSHYVMSSCGMGTQPRLDKVCYSWQVKMHVDHLVRLSWLTCLASHLVWINYFCLLIWGIRLLAITVYHGDGGNK
jgi:hypothetical protein